MQYVVHHKKSREGENNYPLETFFARDNATAIEETRKVWPSCVLYRYDMIESPIGTETQTEVFVWESNNDNSECLSIRG